MVYCSVQRVLTLFHVLSQINPVRALLPIFFKMHLIFILQALLN